MMKRSKLADGFSALALGLLTLGAATALAHHPIEAKFDRNKETTMTGLVTAVDWRNPHTHVFMNVETPAGLENWAVELESPIILRQSGWRDDSLQPGDEITVEGITARDGTRQIWGETLTFSGSGDAVYTATLKKPPLPLAPRPTPRWPDGTAALGSTTGAVDGYWGFPSETVLVEDGVEIELDEYGMLANLDDAAKVAPLQPWALGVYKHRQQRFLQEDPMYLNCKPPGGPRQYQSNLGFQLLEDKENSRIFVLIGSGNHNFRIMYTDGRAQTGLVIGDDDNPLYYGRASAHWEGDTLVVSTKGFNEDFWFSNGGLPHTSLLEMEERFTRSNADTLQYAVTINDPGAYTRAWSASWTMQWVGGEELPVHFCQNNRQ
jgi:uncharacterized protein DUF6152